MEENRGKWYQLDRRSLSNLVVICVGVLLYQGVTHIAQIKAVLYEIMSVLQPFIVGFVIAYLLNTPINYCEKKLFQKFKNPRIPSLITVYLIALVAIAVLLQLIIPQVGDSVANLIGNLSSYLENVNVMAQDIIERFHLEEEGLTDLVADYQTIINRAAEFITVSVPNLLNLGIAVGNGLVTALTALIASIYMLAGKDRFVAQMKKLVFALFPVKRSSRILDVAKRANYIFVSFINGKIIDSAIIGVLCFGLTLLLRIPYPELVSVVVGITNVIPFFGPFIGAVPCLMILLMVNPWAALRFLIMILALQQFDGNILGPKILGNSTGLSALWVLVGIVVGGGLFGFMGMLLGVPTFAVLYSLVREWSNRKLMEKGIDAEGNPISQQQHADMTPVGK